MKLVEGAQNSPLLRRISGIRRQMATDFGYMVPPVRVTDNLQLKSGEYVVLLKGAELARFEMMQELRAGDSSWGLRASSRWTLPTKEPAFGIPGAVDSLGEKPTSRALRDTRSSTPVSILGTHLAELIRRHAYELLSRQDTKNILDRVTEENPKVVEDLVPKLLPMAIVQKVFQNLLRERVSIRDSVTILEGLGEAAAMTKNPILLTEYARSGDPPDAGKAVLKCLRRALLPSLSIRRWNRSIEKAIEYGEQSSHINLAPQKIREILDNGDARGGVRAIRRWRWSDAVRRLATTCGK